MTAAWLPLTILISLGLLWGGVTNVARYIGLSDTPPLGYAFWTVLIGALLLTMVNIFRRQRVPLSVRHIGYFLAAGTLTSGLPTANMFVCLNYISVGAMSLVLTMVPLVTYLLSFIFGLEQRNLKRASGIGLGLLGALLVILPENGLPSDQPIGWFLLAFLSPIGYAAGNVYTAKCRPADIDSLVGANGMMCGSALLLLTVTLISDQWFVLWSAPSLIDSLISLCMG